METSLAADTHLWTGDPSSLRYLRCSAEHWPRSRIPGPGTSALLSTGPFKEELWSRCQAS